MSLCRGSVALAAACAIAAGLGCGAPDRDGVVLWHAYSGAERDALEQVVDNLRRQQNLHVSLVQVPHEAFADKLTNAIPNGNGPDLFIFAHDRIGDWVTGDLIEPIEFYADEALADRFATEALSAMAYEESLYGLPLAVKSAALYYRTDLISEPPRTTDDLERVAAALADRGFDGYPLIYENTDLYPHAIWLHGFGGSVFDESGELSIATPEATAALAFARNLDRRRIVPAGVDGKMVPSLFNAGKVSMAISGPWFLGDIEEDLPFAITTLPTVSATGLPAAPFLGVEGVLMSARARDKRAAFAVMDALTDSESAAHRAMSAQQVVPNPSAYEIPEIANNELLAAFRSQMQRSVPMPATPAMRSVWTPYKTALHRVIDQDADPADALRDAEREVRGYLSGEGLP